MSSFVIPDFNAGEKHNFALQTEGNGYHGLIAEDSTVVNVTPPIKAVGELVCGFSIINHHHRADLPFDVSFVNQGAPLHRGSSLASHSVAPELNLGSIELISLYCLVSEQY